MTRSVNTQNIYVLIEQLSEANQTSFQHTSSYQSRKLFSSMRSDIKQELKIYENKLLNAKYY